MKKFLLFAVVALSLSACTFNDGPDEYLVSETYYVTLASGDWRAQNEGDDFYIYASAYLPAISADVIDHGTVLAYYLSGYDNLLPYVRLYESGYFEVISYDLEEEYITFKIEGNDVELPAMPVGALMDFKVVVLRTIYN